MYLDEVEERIELIAERIERSSFSPLWHHSPVSYLSDHKQSCCELAREWLRAMDFAQLNGGALLSGPRWLRERYEWGPSAWPVHWCEAVGSKIVDCGVHSALANEIFEARGIVSFRAQFVQLYNPQAIEQWRTIWNQNHVPGHWLGTDSIYHEGNAILIGEDSVKLWDGSASCWVNPVQTRGYGTLCALRIAKPASWTGPAILQWGGLRVALNEWNHVGEKARIA
jgi:hypothetical protein